MTADVVHNVAVLGTGSVGMRHLNALVDLPSVQTCAIPIRPKKAHELRDKGYRTCADLPAAAAQGVTALIVATDTSRHVEDSLTALRMGLHVLVEKPLAVDATEATKLRPVAAAAGRKVYVGCVLRFSDSLQLFRKWLPRAGRLHSVRIECQSYLPDWRPDRPYQQSYSARKGEGGVLRDLIHEIDYAGWLFGWPGAVQARLRNLGRLQIEAEEIAELSWETGNGAILSMSLDYLSRPPRRVMRVFGEHGTLEWDGIAQRVSWLAADDGSSEEKILSQTRDEMLVAQGRAFLHACTQENAETTLADLEDGIKAIKICDAAREASANHRETVIQYA